MNTGSLVPHLAQQRGEPLVKRHDVAAELLALCGQNAVDEVERTAAVEAERRRGHVLAPARHLIEQDAEAMTRDVLAVFQQACDGFDQMRLREGEKLAEDVRSRCAAIERMVGEVETRSPERVREYREKLLARMQEVLADTSIDETRILTEAAIYADKTAVDEETVRLRSHLHQMDEMLKETQPVGRKLDFLVQEMNREANTIGSKAGDVAMARIVVDIKSEIEKIREQIQNIE